MSDPTQDTALRMALRSMLADPTYPAKWQGRPWVEARLAETDWPAELRALLTHRALQWARHVGPGVEETLRKALGETMATETVLPSQDRLGRTRDTLRTYQGETQSMTPSVMMHNAPDAEDSPMAELVGEQDWTELVRQAEVIQQPPWSHDPARVAKAVDAIQAGAVRLDAAASRLAYVQSADGKRTYTVREEGCTCRATHPCYHMTAAELYRLWRTKDTTPSLFPPTKTVDERLAAVPEAPLDLMTESIPEPEEDPMPTATVESPPPPLPAPVGQTPLRKGTAPRPMLGSPLLALPLRSIHAISADLARPLPPKCIVEKQQGGRAISFIHWYTAVEVLDAYAPGWRGEVRSIQEVTTVVGNKGSLRSVKAWATTYRITIPCAEGEVYREAIGLEHEDEPIYGDTMTNSQATAFKRCAALFGVAADLYDKDESGEHLTGALVQEKAALLKMLRPELERRGLDPQEVLAWLKRQTQAQRNADLSIGALKALMAHLEIVEADAPEDAA